MVLIFQVWYNPALSTPFNMSFYFKYVIPSKRSMGYILWYALCTVFVIEYGVSTNLSYVFN